MFVAAFLCWLLTAWAGAGVLVSAEIGPFDSLVRSYIGGAKDFVERVLVQVRVPKIVQDPGGKGLSFQLDESPDGVLLPECKECKLHASEALVGTWHVVLFSNRFMLTVIADLDSHIDKLESNQPLTDQRTLYEWLTDPPQLVCPQLTVLDPTEATKMEFAYTVNPGGKHKSIVNKWDRQMDSTIYWHLTPKLSVHICPTVVEPDLVILRQIDSFPKCDNIIVLIRGEISDEKIDSIRDSLELQHTVLSTNSLVKLKCPVVPPGVVNG